MSNAMNTVGKVSNNMIVERTTVITIDDHPLFRKGLADLIDMAPELQLLGEAADGCSGLALAAELRPELILLDMNMNEMDGLATLKAIKNIELDSRVIMLTVSDSEEDVIAALRSGAEGYLLKDMEPEDTLKYLRQAAAGKMVISERLTELLAHALLNNSRQVQNSQQAGLTEREVQILKLVSQGMSNKLVARNLNISEGTVKVHMKHILKKINLRTRVEAAVWMINSDI